MKPRGRSGAPPDSAAPAVLILRPERKPFDHNVVARNRVMLPNADLRSIRQGTLWASSRRWRNPCFKTFRGCWLETRWSPRLRSNRSSTPRARAQNVYRLGMTWSPGNGQKKSQAFAQLPYLVCLRKVFAPRALGRFGMYREFDFLFFLNVREDRKQVLRLRVPLFAKHPH